MMVRLSRRRSCRHSQHSLLRPQRATSFRSSPMLLWQREAMFQPEEKGGHAECQQWWQEEEGGTENYSSKLLCTFLFVSPSIIKD